MELTRASRRITTVLFLAQSAGSAGMIAASTVNAIVGARLSGDPALSGVPGAAYMFGTAFGALLWGFAMDRLGRRGAMVMGVVTGLMGAAISSLSVISSQFIPYLLGVVLLGGAGAALGLGRFIAAEVNPPDWRGRAISRVVFGGAIGSIVGPLLVGPAGTLVSVSGSDPLAGPFIATFALLLLAALLIIFGLRPDPRQVGMEIARLHPIVIPGNGLARSVYQIFRQPVAAMALASMVFGQLVMVALMSMTSLHMEGHQHGLNEISLVISSHTFGMFAFSAISGRLADRLGRLPVILIGSATLILAALLAPLSPNVIPLAVSLFFLGLGWNFCFVGGSTLLADQLMPAERARTQAFNDLLVGMTSAVGSLGSGLVYARLGFSMVAWMGTAISLALFIFVLWRRPRKSTAYQTAQD